MLPPIPDPVTPVAPQRYKARPHWLIWITVLFLTDLGMSNYANTFAQPIYSTNQGGWDWGGKWLVYGLLSVVIYFLWIGKNWARLVLVVWNVLHFAALLDVSATPEQERWARVSVILSGVVICMLFFPSVVEFCKGNRSNGSV